MDILHWGVIGCGDIARKRVLPALTSLPNCRVTAVTREQADKAQTCAEEFAIPKAYNTLQELLQDDEIEAVYIATPHYLHAEQTIQAAEAGKHILCEKPMAMNSEECDAMIKACEEHGVKLGIAYYRHYYPVIHRIKDVLQQGLLGKPIVVQINAFEQFNPAPDEPRSWLSDPSRSGGGPMNNIGCHRIEICIDLFGAVKNVFSRTANILYDLDVEDTATTILEFSNGPICTITVTSAASEPQDSLHIFLSEGSIHVPVLNKGTIIEQSPTDKLTEKYPPPSNVHRPVIEDFTRAVLEDREPLVTGEIGKAVTQVLDSIYGV
jgi:predicted dehydrogenase